MVAAKLAYSGLASAPTSSSLSLRSPASVLRSGAPAPLLRARPGQALAFWVGMSKQQYAMVLATLMYSSLTSLQPARLSRCATLRAWRTGGLPPQLLHLRNMILMRWLQ